MNQSLTHTNTLFESKHNNPSLLNNYQGVKFQRSILIGNTHKSLINNFCFIIKYNARFLATNGKAMAKRRVEKILSNPA